MLPHDSWADAYGLVGKNVLVFSPTGAHTGRAGGQHEELDDEDGDMSDVIGDVEGVH
jgi:hypothetical protein